EFQVRITALRQALAQLGWTEGRNLRLDIRWANTNPDLVRKHATELVALAPDSSSRPVAQQPQRRCSMRPAPCRSGSRSLSTQSAPVSLRAWRGPAAISPASSCSNTA